MSLFRGENPSLGSVPTVHEVGATATSNTALADSDFKPSTRELVDVTMQAAAQHVSQWIYRAPFKCQVIGVRENHTVASTSGTIDIVKIAADAIAPAAANGTTIVSVLTAPMSTSGAANTRQNLALSATAAALVLNSGDQLAAVAGGVATNYAGGIVQVEVIQLS